MLGKLTLSAIPYHNPIIMGAVGFSILVGLVILGLITKPTRIEKPTAPMMMGLW